MANGVESDDRTFGFEREHARSRSLLPDPAYLWMVFRRRFWLFAIAAVLVLIAVAGAVLSAKPVYLASSTVLIEPRKTETIDLRSVVQGLPPDTNVVDTQVQIIGSPTTALAVVRRLRLTEDAEFGGGQGEALAARPASARATAPSRLEPMSQAERGAVSALLRNVYVKRAGLTYVIEIGARSRSADKAMNIANAIAAEYIALQEAQRASTSEDAGAFVSGRAVELRQQAVADDRAVQEYMIAHNLMSAEGATMAEQEVSQLNQQIAQAQAKLAEERGKLATATGQVSRGDAERVGAVISSDTIRSLRGQEATASAELNSLRARYGELHPDVLKARQNLDAVKQQIAAERTRIIAALQANVQVAASGLSSLEASRAQARGSLASNSSAQVGLLELKRKAEASSAIYSAFLQRAKETTATTNIPQADVRISSFARLPDAPAWPNYKLAALFGILAAIAVGLVVIGISEYLDGSLSTREEVEDELGVTYAGAVPDLKSALGRGSEVLPPYVYILSHPFSAFAEAVRNVGAMVTRRKTQGAHTGGRVIAITSPLPREGKTSLSICLARVFAMGRSRVVLIDGDLRRHQVSELLVPDARIEERLLKVLEGLLPLSEALVKDDSTELMILPTRGPTSTEDFLTPERVDKLYESLRAQFDIVIVDTAPLLGIVDTRSLTQQADATLVICHWRKTSLKAVRAALDILAQSGANVAGVALSRVNIRQYASTGHGDTYGYHKQFAGYYVN